MATKSFGEQLLPGAEDRLRATISHLIKQGQPQAMAFTHALAAELLGVINKQAERIDELERRINQLWNQP